MARKKLFGRKVLPQAPGTTGTPIFLMVGSLSGCTRKDALQYARGLAEANVISPALGRLQVTYDKRRDRYVYEIHEGGIEHTIAEKVVAAIDAGQPVRIALVNGAHLTVEEEHGELFSLVHPALPEAAPVHTDSLDEVDVPVVAAPAFSDVLEFASTTALEELFPEDKSLFKIGLISLAVSFFAFMVLGLSYTFMQAGLFDKDALFTLTKAGQIADSADNPAWQLEKARTEANKAGTYIKSLKKGPKGWSWEFAQ